MLNVYVHTCVKYACKNLVTRVNNKTTVMKVNTSTYYMATTYNMYEEKATDCELSHRNVREKFCLHSTYMLP